MKTPPEVRVHRYQADQTMAPDWKGRRPCAPPCGMPEKNRVHDVPEPDPEAAVIDARILGETNEERNEGDTP